MEKFSIPVSYKVFVWLFALTVVLPCVITSVALTSRPSFDWRIFNLVLGVSTVFLLILTVPMLMRRMVTLDEKYIQIQMAFYSEKIALADLKPALIANLANTPELQLSTRTNGIGLLGYHAGWFVMKNGSKAFAAVTADSVIHIPTTKGFSLLFSVEKADDLMRALSRKI